MVESEYSSGETSPETDSEQGSDDTLGRNKAQAKKQKEALRRTAAYNSRKKDRQVPEMFGADGELLSKRICASTAKNEYKGSTQLSCPHLIKFRCCKLSRSLSGRVYTRLVLLSLLQSCH